MVSTHLKNISQNGNLPQIGVKIKNIWNHHPESSLIFCWTPWRVLRFNNIDALSLALAIDLDNSVPTHSISVQPTRGFCCTNKRSRSYARGKYMRHMFGAPFLPPLLLLPPLRRPLAPSRKLRNNIFYMYVYIYIQLMAKQNPTSPKRCINNPYINNGWKVWTKRPSAINMDSCGNFSPEDQPNREGLWKKMFHVLVTNKAFWGGPASHSMEQLLT